MPQWFKSLYFSDHPGDTPKRRNLKLAFGPSDEHVFQLIQGLSSHQLRELIGVPSYSVLRASAEEAGESVNRFCVSRLRTIAARSGVDGQRLAVDEQQRRIDPLKATFRGGKNEPLHDWYPYLEGYSPEFVERLLLEFSPDAQHVCDPFAGTGTTPLTVARLGRRSFFCELNPLLQFLIGAKVVAYNLSRDERQRTFAELKVLAASLPERIERQAEDRRLAESFARVFGTSRFFTEATLAQVLRFRSLLDELACADYSLAHLATVAVVSSLIPASLLVRRGDVRFKNEGELKRPQVSLIDLVTRRLDQIAHDLLQIAPLGSLPVLLCSDARNLHKVCPAAIDAVITSPPYLNGTNYFRNTKVELWFLRCLTTADDLAQFRLRAVTAGINDVTVGKPTAPPTSAIADLVKSLKRSAYDPRIPRMVQTYFHDLKSVFDGLVLHLKSDATILIDIGDSCYGGVRVATPTLLRQMLEESGYRSIDEIVLRRRASRSGEPLSQVLLVMRAPVRPHSRFVSPPSKAEWWSSWTRFKRELPHQSGELAKRNWGHPLHSLCSYQGKMKPSLAASLVKTFLPSNGELLDPFGGVGTIPLEAANAGHRSWSFDISPAAVQIARAKLEPTTMEACANVIKALDEFIQTERINSEEFDETHEIRFNGRLADYFHRETFAEIIKARRFFLQHPPAIPAESLVFSSLLHILHGNRPYALSRRSHPITPFAPSGPTEFRRLVHHLNGKVQRSLAEPRPKTFLAGRSLVQDATETWPQEVDQLDAIITSPPFFDSTRFYLANWMRLWFCGWNAADFKQKPLAFVDERQKRSFEVYEPVLRQSRERLKAGGVLVLHLGRSRKCDMADQLRAIARHWFKVADLFHENVGHCESHGIRDKGTVAEHSYLVLT